MRKVIVFAVLSLLITGFIWGNSIKTIEQSKDQSTPVAETIQPVVDPQQKIPKPVFHELTRKMAHVTEFFALGLSVAVFSACLGAYLKRRFISMPILLVLLVAVLDEYIQYFAKRGSLVTDVVLDFSGAMAALVLVWLVRGVIALIKKRKERML
jgi:VanZ family protein